MNSTLGALLVALFSPLLVSNVLAECVAPPAGLVSWWRGETNALDQAGTNHGTLGGNTTYGSGRVGQGFVFDGNADLVTMGNPTNLQLQDFTIEAWVKRDSAAIVSSGSYGIGVILGYGEGGYGLIMLPDGHVALSLIGTDAVSAGPAIVATGFQHVAVTKSGSTVVVYINGVAYPAAAYNPTFTFSTLPAIGARGDNLDNSFMGAIDEVSVYSRALATNEVQAIYSAGNAGKCVVIAPPCAPAPAGLVSWWRGETNALDQAGTNHGTLGGNTTYGSGRVGQGFMFDGNADLVTMGNPTNLQLQNFTIEAWVKRDSAAIVSSGSYGIGVILGYGEGGYGLIMLPDGHVALSLIGTDAVSAGPAIVDAGFHHVAVSKSGSTVVVYIDGVAYPTEAYNSTFTFSSVVAIGARGDNLDNSFLAACRTYPSKDF